MTGNELIDSFQECSSGLNSVIEAIEAMSTLDSSTKLAILQLANQISMMHNKFGMDVITYLKESNDEMIQLTECVNKL